MLYFDKLHARIRMHIYMLTHAHADPTWTPPFLTWTRTILHGLHGQWTQCGPNRPVDQYKKQRNLGFSMLSQHEHA